MYASNQTTNYDLSQWLPTDPVHHEDFNGDNAKLDAALAAKADAAETAELADAVDGLASAVGEHATLLDTKGNCRVFCAYYIGTGLSGASHDKFFNFPPDRPVLVLIVDDQNDIFLRMVRASTRAQASNNFEGVTVAWGEHSVSWYADSANAMMKENGVKYHVFVLRDCDGEKKGEDPGAAARGSSPV